MHAILNTFKSGVGDCVFMRLIKDDATFSIMIDCGKYTPEINLFIKENCISILIFLLLHT